ncbi:MAG: hypothetical protein ACI9MR_000960 [Myxococcota bacterium]|jgi:hypothetical protein
MRRSSLVRCGKVLLSLSCLALLAATPTVVYAPPDPEPSDGETLMLEYLNRARADPVAEAARIQANPGGHFKLRGKDVDWKKFHAEMKQFKPLPPLVMNLQLLLGARRHAHFLTINKKRGHWEALELPAFSGAKISQRILSTGYRYRQTTENVYVAVKPWDVHTGFVVDLSRKSKDGMLKGRGHRLAIFHPQMREVGPAEYKRDRDFLFTHGFADRKAPRLVGGVVYRDLNGNAFYDTGEGVGGVKITADDGTKTTTWKSGGYALELKSAAAAATLTATYAAASHTAKFPAGTTNIKFDWVMKATKQRTRRR